MPPRRRPDLRVAAPVLSMALLFGCGDDPDDADDLGAGTSAADASSGDDAPDPSGGATQPSTATAAGDTGGGSDDDSTGDGLPPPGVACDSSFVHEGYKGCLSEIGGLQVKFFPVTAGAQVQRLVIFFHGDTGMDWIDDWGFRPEILDWAWPQDMLVLGIMAPSSYEGETAPSYGAAQPDHAVVVADAIEYFLAQYEVPAERSLYWGVSGGSWFFTSSFIPAAGQRVPGIFAASCGGSGGSFGWAWDPATDIATRDLNALLLNYGDQDFLADNEAASYDEYTSLGFVTDEIVYPGAPHCEHPIAEPTIAFWEAQLP